ncbi:CHAP domain-containing protein [Streptomyces flavotricini]|uniref:CHAP domain-containing protein n=1 Tax=Streptomyces flavotricini TaxID=66888 RepID=A0ABS8EH97_9ACTN|nr:CHAP domain-containing protein [Streptomyces flavotricini]MCC0100324.1 CHAP domain-containing protein [Streptomyces flavotricini]
MLAELHTRTRRLAAAALVSVCTAGALAVAPQSMAAPQQARTAAPSAAQAASAAAAAPGSGARIAEVALAELANPHGCTYYSGNGSCPPWCAVFAKWVWSTAGVADLNHLDPWADSFLNYGSDRLFSTPQVGDAAVYDNPGRDSDHVNIVVAVSADGSKIKTVGGNESGRVESYNNGQFFDWRRQGPAGPASKFVRARGADTTPPQPFGAGVREVMGDWDGDGVDTPGIYRGNHFALRNSNNAGFSDIDFAYGNGGDWIPIAGDWDGDGKDEVGVYMPDSGTFALRSTTNPAQEITTSFRYGNGADWLPLVGDWDGDGKDEVGVYMPDSGTFALRSTTNPAQEITTSFRYGNPNWVPTAGDWDGDGKDEVGAYVPQSSTFVLRSNTNPAQENTTSFMYGNPYSFPLAGDWNHDGKDEVGVFFKESAVFALRSNTVPGQEITNAFPYGNPR